MSTSLRLLLVFVVFAGPVTGARAAAPEYQVKAAFLFNFTQFVEWPPPAVPTAPFVIGVLGHDPFQSFLEDTIRDEQTHGRRLIVAHFRRGEPIGDCDILFISGSETTDLEAILTSLRGRPILTVSDSPDFAPRGGAIQFFTVNNKLRLRINQSAAHAAHLTISSQLLRLADIVPSAED